MPGHLVALELNGQLLVGGRPELYPLRLPLRPRRARRPRARGCASAPRRRALRARREAAPRRVARRDAPPAARPRRRADVRRVAGRAPRRCRPDVPRHGDALDGRAGGDHGGRRARATSRSSGAPAPASRATSSAAPARSSTASPPSCAGRVVHDAEVQEVVPEGELVRVRYRQAGAERELRARHAIVATKAFDAARLIRDLPAETEQRAERDPLRPDRRDGDADERDAADAVGRPLRARHAQARVQHALQHRQRPAAAQPRARARRQPDGVPRRPRRADDVRAARRRRRAGVPRRPLRDLPRGARDRGRDDPAQDAAHAALRGARPRGAAARARAAARPHAAGRRLPRRRLHRHRHLERPGGGAGRADVRCRPPSPAPDVEGGARAQPLQQRRQRPRRGAGGLLRAERALPGGRARGRRGRRRARPRLQRHVRRARVALAIRTTSITARRRRSTCSRAAASCARATARARRR